MKTKIYLVVLTFLSLSNFYAQVGIGTTTPDPSAILDIEATDMGLLPPRMNTNQRDAIQNPSDGLLIYNTTTGSLNYYNQGWFEMKGSALEGLVACNTITEGRLEGDVPAASDVKSKIIYAKSNGTPYDALTIQSTGVTGLTASLDAGTFNVNGGELEFTITGTPQGTAGGDAIFAITIGGQSCFHKRVVEEKFVCGSSTVTASYNSLPITYGSKVGPNNTCWLDRNLGATQVYSGTGNVGLSDALSLGGLYQWGRKDDGHQTGVYIPFGDSQIGGDFHYKFDASIVTNQSPDLFPVQPATIQPAQGEQWFDVSLSNSSNAFNDFLDDLSALWYDPSNNAIGPSNPCPDGWRVPTTAEFHAFYNSGNEPTIPKFEPSQYDVLNSRLSLSGSGPFLPQVHTSTRPEVPEFIQGQGISQSTTRVSSYTPDSGMNNVRYVGTRENLPVRCIRHE